MKQTPATYSTHPFQSLATILKKIEHEFAERKTDVLALKIVPFKFTIVRDPELLKAVYADPETTMQKEVSALWRMIWMMPKGGVINPGTDDCMARKKNVMKAVKPRALDHYINCLPPIFEKYITRWKQQKDAFDINHDILEMVVEATFMMFFSKKLEGKELSDIAKKVEYLNRNFISRYPKYTPTMNGYLFRKYALEMKEIFKNILRERINDENQDLITHLKDMRYEDGSAYTENEILDEICNVYFGGTAITALTCWATYWLASHPETQSKILAEITRLPHEAAVKDILYLPYVNMTVKEILRLTPTFWCTVRETKKDFAFGETTIAANSKMLLSIYHAHRHPSHWQKPHEFYPEHFLPEVESIRHPSIYFPFGRGPRICIGQHLSTMFLSLFIATLVKSTKITHHPSSPENPKQIIGFENFPNEVRVKFEQS